MIGTLPNLLSSDSTEKKEFYFAAENNISVVYLSAGGRRGEIFQ